MFSSFFFFLLLIKSQRDSRYYSCDEKRAHPYAHVLPGNKRDEGNNEGNGVGESAMKRPKMALFTPKAFDPMLAPK
jgi:hypothetical protein